MNINAYKLLIVIDRFSDLLSSALMDVDILDTYKIWKENFTLK